MSDGINRSVERQAMRIIRIEQLLMVLFGVSTAALLAAAIYFEKTYGVRPYSFAFALAFFLLSVACFRALFALFGDSLQHRARTGRARALFSLASLYMVIAALAAYVVAFSLFGLRMPWAGDGREYLYSCYFLLAASVIFLARSAVFYWRLRSYIMQSLEHLSK